MKEIKTRIPVYDLEGKVVENFQLDKELFDGVINKTLLYEVNKMYEASKRQGNASSKTRSEVKGGGSKPWRQKGTGRARVGSSRNPVWRHGGSAFGPRPRDYSYTVPKKAVRKALLSSLNARLTEDMIKAILKIDVKEIKTREFKKILDNLKLGGKTLIVVNEPSREVRLASRNLEGVTLKESRNINARDVLLNEWLLIEKDALEKLTERLR